MAFSWSHPGLPPRPWHVAILDGEPAVLYAGSLDVLSGPHVVIWHQTVGDAQEYLEGGQGFSLGQTSPAIALFRRLEPRPVAKKPWAELSEQTKRGYRGRMRSMGVRSEAEMARFHASADSATLHWLRRHGERPADLIVVGGYALYPARGSGVWATVWEQK